MHYSMLNLGLKSSDIKNKLKKLFKKSLNKRLDKPRAQHVKRVA
tara:strand:+ start:1179 stop:1310 length:132 start_codon:yes stop_codon:yes gene_type:complete